jgi:glycosyltransferase involved in cell wall biosynthesis
MSTSELLDPLLSLVVPVHDEAQALPLFLAEITRVLDPLGLSYEVWFVDDGSQDDTLPLLRKAHRDDERIQFISLSRNFGKERAMAAGLDHARGQSIVVMDVDLQDPPSLLPLLVERWKEGAQVVHAVRSRRLGDPMWKRFSSMLFARLFGLLVGFQTPGHGGDFCLMDRRVVDALRQCREGLRYSKGLFSWVGFRQACVAFERPLRSAGKSRWGFVSLVALAMDGVCAFSVWPLRLASFTGGALALLTLFLSVGLIGKCGLPLDRDQIEWLMLCGLFFVGAVQLLCMGLMGEYLGRLYLESRARPLYLIQEKSQD